MRWDSGEHSGDEYEGQWEAGKREGRGVTIGRIAALGER